MLYFANDYAEGAHPLILRRLMETNMEPQGGYGRDAYCVRAEERIRAACESEDSQVFFLVGGTQTNAVVIDALLRGYEGVVAADTGHVATHEAGAIEATGHKVLSLPNREGKVEAAALEGLLSRFWNDPAHNHMVFPGMVYISHPTEQGTLYSLSELKALSDICRRRQIPLYMDGARLGYGLAARDTDVTLPQIARLCDVFYIGGTKVGALCGEAVVFAPGRTPANFRTSVKRRGAMLAKGRLLGVQFDVLFEDDLYMKISQNAIERARELKEIFLRNGYELFVDSPTNQQFVLLEEKERERLARDVVFTEWKKLEDGRTAARFATSWATTRESVLALDELLGQRAL